MAFTVGYIIGIVIGLVLLGALMPTAFSSIFNANTTGWDANTVTIFTLIPLFVAVIFIAKLALDIRGGGKD